jgi:hypothetical protein
MQNLDDMNPHALGFNGPPDGDVPCDDGSPPRTPSMFIAFIAYALAWLRSAALDILVLRMPRRPYYSRPMPMIASLTGGADFTLAASMHGRRRGGPQVFGGSRHLHGARCRAVGYLPNTVVVVQPGYAAVRTYSDAGATHMMQEGWIAKRRDAMQRSASLTFGRSRTRTSKA